MKRMKTRNVGSLRTTIDHHEDHRALSRWRTQREEGSEGPN